MGATAIMGGVQMGLGAYQFFEAKNNADAIKSAAQFEANQLRFNATLLDYQKNEIIQNADMNIKRRGELTSQMIGAQKAAFAGQGVDLSSDVVQELRSQEQRFGAEDLMEIRNNAWKEAMGIEIKQEDMKLQARVAELTGQSKARSTLATGGISGAATALDGFSKMYNKG